MWFYVFEMNWNRTCTIEKNFLFTHILFRCYLSWFIVKITCDILVSENIMLKSNFESVLFGMCWKYENSICWHSQYTIEAYFVQRMEECNKWMYPRDITVFFLSSSDQQVPKCRYFQLLFTFPQWKYSSQTFWWHEMHFESYHYESLEKNNF